MACGLNIRIKICLIPSDIKSDLKRLKRAAKRRLNSLLIYNHNV